MPYRSSDLGRHSLHKTPACPKPRAKFINMFTFPHSGGASCLTSARLSDSFPQP